MSAVTIAEFRVANAPRLGYKVAADEFGYLITALDHRDHTSASTAEAAVAAVADYLAGFESVHGPSWSRTSRQATQIRDHARHIAAALTEAARTGTPMDTSRWCPLPPAAAPDIPVEVAWCCGRSAHIFARGKLYDQIASLGRWDRATKTVKVGPTHLDAALDAVRKHLASTREADSSRAAVLERGLWVVLPFRTPEAPKVRQQIQALGGIYGGAEHDHRWAMPSTEALTAAQDILAKAAERAKLRKTGAANRSRQGSTYRPQMPTPGTPVGKGGTCDNCGEARRALIHATDSSGIPGRACRACYGEGDPVYLSFA